MAQESKAIVPGIHPSVRMEVLLEEELQIVNKLSTQYWYITRASEIYLGRSRYRYILMKPTSYISQNFNLYREVLVVFTSYENFEPRALDVLDELHIQDLRLEEVCFFVISKDIKIQQALERIVKSNHESRVIVPYSYEELLNRDDEYFVNKMRQCFYTRDLFGVQDPLKQEIYFFGRQDIISELVNKHLCKECSGIFGLRKTGKTSILYGVQRLLVKKNTLSIIIDCQTLHTKTWNIALRSITQRLISEGLLKTHLLDSNLAKYESTMSAPDAFMEDIQTIFKNNNKRSILLIFDEIEHISPKTSASRHWQEDNDFIMFWQTIRSTYQTLDEKFVFSYLIAGTNPRCIETPIFNNIDNPIFMQIQPMYIAPFTVKQTKDMLSCLGGYMGIYFTDEVYTHINEDFGGHPLLIRQMCSFIHRYSSVYRPILIGKAEYEELKKQYIADTSGFDNYAEMVLYVLKMWYPDEYYMLEMLAAENTEDFNAFAEMDENYIKHLLAYGIIAKDKTQEKFHFQIEALKQYFLKKDKYMVLAKTENQMVSEINDRRHKIEKKLNKFVKNTLLLSLGEDAAKKSVIKQLYGAKSISEYQSVSYNDLFDVNLHKMYLSILFEIIRLNYKDIYDNFFKISIDTFMAHANLINKYRTDAAHTKTITKEDYESFRSSAAWIESRLEMFD